MFFKIGGTGVKLLYRRMHRIPCDEQMIEKCPFCDIDSERIIFSNEHAVAIFDAFPVNPGHMLIIPKNHHSDFFSLNKDEYRCILELLHRCHVHIDDEFRPDGYNIGVNIGPSGGQSIPHLHVHLIPRHRGDVENPRGGVRGVIPEKQDYS